MWKKGIALFLAMALVLASCSPSNKVAKEGLDWEGGELSLSATNGLVLSAYWNGVKLSSMSDADFAKLTEDDKFINTVENTLVNLKVSVDPNGKLLVIQNLAADRDQEMLDMVVTALPIVVKKGDKFTITVTTRDHNDKEVKREVKIKAVK
ncbi:hypothetical protein [Entomospira culicis]|uniref:Uncharacterized protein n=1 Tax=Entomospira culicis TaxID=2719989 RepID=A0A968GFR1_9SPIO|nr:hypothetical protein [Entomospira culicis]NIZ19334.1 hypothetical protein [Entomospira culicis]NIZ69761.1 hypothetical protein [Entomospira culicis]WDI36872.1 hypothetical protein PVA46_05975 [Entomospira culicis]WDI38501.1 hypothetical protein PVA47_05985 [Entomospira culicis]